MSTEKKDIELRSEKVRNIVGQIPPLLLRKGILIISLVILGVIVGSYFMPYPETLSTEIYIYSAPQSEIIKAPQDGIIFFDDSLSCVLKDQKIGDIKTNDDSIIELRSIADGKLIHNCKNKGIIGQGDLLFAVISNSIENLYGTGFVNSQIKTKVKIRQKINLELNEYPSLKYGLIEGYVSKIYSLPEDTLSQLVKIEFSLPNELKTSYGNSFEYTPMMKGQATIYISDQSVLARFVRSMGFN